MASRQQKTCNALLSSNRNTDRFSAVGCDARIASVLAVRKVGVPKQHQLLGDTMPQVLESCKIHLCTINIPTVYNSEVPIKLSFC